MPDREKIKFNVLQEETVIRQYVSDVDITNYYRIIEKDIIEGQLRYVSGYDVEELYTPGKYVSSIWKSEWDLWSENPRYSFHLESTFGEPDWII